MKKDFAWLAGKLREGGRAEGAGAGAGREGGVAAQLAGKGSKLLLDKKNRCSLSAGLTFRSGSKANPIKHLPSAQAATRLASRQVSERNSKQRMTAEQAGLVEIKSFEEHD